jgi:hypothetical protein
MKKFVNVMRVGALALTLLFLLTGCGKDKYSTPVSGLVYEGPRPKILKVDVSPSATHLQYFKFKLEMSDPNLSTLPGDHWTIEGCRGYFMVDDTSAVFIEPLPDIDVRSTIAVSSTYTTSYTVPLLTKEWIEKNCHWLVDTETRVPVTLHLQFYAHRNSDGLKRVIPVDFSFTIGDY